MVSLKKKKKCTPRGISSKKTRLSMTTFWHFFSQKPRQSIGRIRHGSWNYSSRIRTAEPRRMRTQREPFAIALGNLTPTNPRATLSLVQHNHDPGHKDNWIRRADGWTDGGGARFARLGSVGRTAAGLASLASARTDGLGSASVGSVGRRRGSLRSPRLGRSDGGGEVPDPTS